MPFEGSVPPVPASPEFTGSALGCKPKKHKHTHTHTNTHTHTHTNKYTHVHTHTHTNIEEQPRARTEREREREKGTSSCTHTHTHPRARTNTLEHTPVSGTFSQMLHPCFSDLPSKECPIRICQEHFWRSSYFNSEMSSCTGEVPRDEHWLRSAEVGGQTVKDWVFTCGASSPQVLAIVGGYHSAVSTRIAPLLATFKTPQVADLILWISQEKPTTLASYRIEKSSTWRNPGKKGGFLSIFCQFFTYSPPGGPRLSKFVMFRGCAPFKIQEIPNTLMNFGGGVLGALKFSMFNSLYLFLLLDSHKMWR